MYKLGEFQVFLLGYDYYMLFMYIKNVKFIISCRKIKKINIVEIC